MADQPKQPKGIDELRKKQPEPEADADTNVEEPKDQNVSMPIKPPQNVEGAGSKPPAETATPQKPAESPAQGRQMPSTSGGAQPGVDVGGMGKPLEQTETPHDVDQDGQQDKPDRNSEQPEKEEKEPEEEQGSDEGSESEETEEPEGETSEVEETAETESSSTTSGGATAGETGGAGAGAAGAEAGGGAAVAEGGGAAVAAGTSEFWGPVVLVICGALLIFGLIFMVIIPGIAGGSTGGSGSSQGSQSDSSGTVSGNVQQLAQQALQQAKAGKVTFPLDAQSPNGSSKTVLQALADGKKAPVTCGNAGRKETGINPNILKFIVAASKETTVGINAITDKCHSNGSAHYSGQAIDLENGAGDLGVILSVAKKYGGTRNDETSHIHLDFPR